MIAAYAVCERTNFQTEQNKFEFSRLTVYNLELAMGHTCGQDSQKRRGNPSSVDTAIRNIVTETVRNGIEIPTMLAEMQKKHDLELD